MKKIMFCVMLMLVFTMSIMAQTEPTPPVPTYEAQICWGVIEETKWQNVVITATEKVGTVPTTHKRYAKTGLQTWVATSCLDTSKIVEFSFNISTIPIGLPLGYYYIRLRGVVEGEVTGWSPVSDWVFMYIPKIPSKPVRN